MLKDIKLELRCKKNDEGSFEAGSIMDGLHIVDPKFFVARGTCNDIQTIHKQLQAAYPGVPIHVGQACSNCIADANA